MTDKFILADTTEERFLHQSVKDLCREFVSGLEDITGCDFIITTLDIPTSNEALIKRHARTGLCVQRKELGDFLQSFKPDDNRLWTQLIRMREVSDIPWLLLIGDLKCTREGKAIVDGRDTGFQYMAMVAAMDYWQLRGGYGSWISRDTLMADWCRTWYNRLVKRDKHGSWGSHMVARPTPQGLYEVSDVERALSTFPLLGLERASSVYEVAKKLNGNLSPSLQDCIIVIQDEKVQGIGPIIRSRVLKFFGWEDDKEDIPVALEDNG